MPVHTEVLEFPGGMQPERVTLTGEDIPRFLRIMREVLAVNGNLENACTVCGGRIPPTWMVVLCPGCRGLAIGGGLVDTLTPAGRAMVYMLNELAEIIQRRRERGNFSRGEMEVELRAAMEIQYVPRRPLPSGANFPMRKRPQIQALL